MTRIPVTVLTGFLGAGKTTLLNRLMAQPGFGDTAVIVNEFGEADIDGSLIARADERAFAISTGCLCCTVAGDVRLTLLRLSEAAESGDGPSFDRVVIETTGIADPSSLLQTFMTNRYMLEHFALNGLVTVVDAVNGRDALHRFDEARRQVAAADLLLLTKTDLAADDGFAETLAAMNPNARISDAAEATPEDVFSLAAFDPAGKPPEVDQWLRYGAPAPAAHDHGHSHDHDHHAHRHGASASAFCFTADRPIARAALDAAVEALKARFGRDLLRIKGLVGLAEHSIGPRILHVVGHISNPPRLLDGWPRGIDRTRIVAIVSGPARESLPALIGQLLPELRKFDRSEESVSVR